MQCRDQPTTLLQRHTAPKLHCMCPPPRHRTGFRGLPYVTSFGTCPYPQVHRCWEILALRCAVCHAPHAVLCCRWAASCPAGNCTTRCTSWSGRCGACRGRGGRPATATPSRRTQHGRCRSCCALSPAYTPVGAWCAARGWALPLCDWVDGWVVGVLIWVGQVCVVPYAVGKGIKVPAHCSVSVTDVL